jgi:hypothetical protein
MGTGKPQINMAVLGHEAKAEEERELGLELAIAQAVEREREQDPVAAEPEHGQAGVALGLVQVGVALELSPVAPGLELSPVAAGLALVRAEAVPGLVRVAEELALALRAVALRTKSVIAAHRPDPVPLLEAGEDLAAAVAETTHGRAAAEAVIAWEAADTAVVVAAPA